MAEPHASTAIAVTAGGISLVAGTVLGLPVAGLVFGFIGGLWALKLDQSDRSLISRLFTVVLSALSAAVFAHPVAEVSRQMVPGDLPTALLIPAAAVGVGAGFELLLRESLAGVVRWIRRLSGAPSGEGSK